MRKYQNKLKKTKLRVYEKTLDVFRCPGALWSGSSERGAVVLLERPGLVDVSMSEQHSCPESWRVFWSFLPRLIYATLYGERAQKNEPRRL